MAKLRLFLGENDELDLARRIFAEAMDGYTPTIRSHSVMGEFFNVLKEHGITDVEFVRPDTRTDGTRVDTIYDYQTMVETYQCNLSPFPNSPTLGRSVLDTGE